MIYADDAKWEVGGSRLKLDRNGRLVKGSVDVVYGDRVVRVGGVTRYIADYRKLAARRGKRLLIDEWRDFGGEVDAVDEDIRLDYFLVGSRFGLSLGKVPFLALSARLHDRKGLCVR